MSASVTFFNVDNGDMTLITLADKAKTKILADIKIRTAADDPEDDTIRDVATDLRERLSTDEKGRPYVDAFLLSHPDQDHILGLQTHFYLGPLADYPDDKKKQAEKKIVVRQMWSSPLVFRRASKNHPLCDDAKAWNAEAKRRVEVNRDKKFTGVGDGDRILIMGADENGKTDDLTSILVKVDQTFSAINSVDMSKYITSTLLAPLPKGNDKEEDLLSKNHSSVILSMSLSSDDKTPGACKFLTGGDAEVEIWERMWKKHKGNKSVLEYDLMQTPHHCSWRTLSGDSWSDKGEKAKVNQDARDALSQALSGAFIVASCKPISDDDKDPPCIRAKREYVDIVNKVKGEFLCTGEYPTDSAPEPLVFDITGEGPQPPAKKEAGTRAAAVISSASRTPMPHGSQ